MFAAVACCLLQVMLANCSQSRPNDVSMDRLSSGDRLRLQLPMTDGSTILLARRSIVSACSVFQISVRNITELLVSWIQNRKITVESASQQAKSQSHAKDDVFEGALVGHFLAIDSAFEFTIEKFLGDWMVFKWLAAPRLKKIIFASESALETRGIKRSRCTGLVMEVGTGRIGPLDLEVSNNFAFDWMESGAKLDMAQYIFRQISQSIQQPNEAALGFMKTKEAAPVFLDLACGSGWLSTIVAARFQQANRIDGSAASTPPVSVLCVDIAVDALAAAKENFKRNNLDVVSSQGDLLEPVVKLTAKGMPSPSFVFFVPPQVSGEQSHGVRGPEVSLQATDSDFLFQRFLDEASRVLFKESITWVQVDIDVVPHFIGLFKDAGWHGALPNFGAMSQGQLGFSLLEMRPPQSTQALSDTDWDRRILLYNRTKEWIHIACRWGQDPSVSRLLRLRADVSEADHMGATPLHWAAYHGHVFVSNLLLSHRASVHTGLKKNPGIKPLHWAASEGRLSVVEFLLQQRADVKDKSSKMDIQPVHLAAAAGRLSVVEYLVLHEGVHTAEAIQTMKRTPVAYSIKNSQWNTAEFLFEYQSRVAKNLTATKDLLAWATETQNVKAMKFLIQRRASVNLAQSRTGREPIHWAAAQGDLPKASLLAEYNAMPDHADARGQQPLHCAAEKGHLQLAKFLISDMAADIKAIEVMSKKQPLHWAAAQGHMPLIKLLLKLRAEMNVRDWAQNSPLDLANKRGQKAISRYLQILNESSSEDGTAENEDGSLEL